MINLYLNDEIMVTAESTEQEFDHITYELSNFHPCFSDCLRDIPYIYISYTMRCVGSVSLFLALSLKYYTFIRF